MADNRFWTQVQKTETCWTWMGYCSPDGYGKFGGRCAHRLSWEEKHGPIPDGLQIDHFRMNPGPRHAPCSRACVNTEHMEPVTSQVNSLRGKTIAASNASKTRCLRGHPFNEVNTRFTRAGRYCRVCDRDRGGSQVVRQRRRRQHEEGKGTEAA